MSATTGTGPGKLAALPAKAPAKKPAAPAPPLDDDLAGLFTEPESEQTASPSGAPSTAPADDFLSEFADAPASPAATTTAQTTGGKKTVPIPASKRGPALVPASKRASEKAIAEEGQKHGTKGIPLERSNELGLKGSEVFLAGLPKSGEGEAVAAGPPKKATTAASPVKRKAPAAVTPQKTIVAPAPKPVQDSMMGHFDISLLERPIESDEEAEAYVAETWLPWATMTEGQKYTRQYCLAYLLEGRKARQAMIRAICDGEAPVGLSVTINELGAVVTTGQPTFNELVEAGVGVVAAHAAVLEREETADPEFEEEALEEGDLEQVEALELIGPGSVYDENAEGEDDLGWATDTGKDVPLAPTFSHAEPDEKYEGPVSPTGMKLIPGVVRPIVVAFMREKDMGKQGELERKLGLDIINSHASVRSMSSDIRKGREVQESPFNNTVDAATTALINEGTRLWKLKQAHTSSEVAPAAASAPVQMEAMREKCRNHGVGCDSARALHRKGTGQCYNDKCACKGKCAEFVGAPTETPEPEGPKSEGDGGDEGPRTEDSSLVGESVMDEFADEPVAAGEVGATAPAPPDPRLAEKHALHNRAGKLHCRLCAGSAALHENFQGVRWAGEPNHSALKCKGFQPENDEKGMEWLALLEDFEKFNAGEDEGQQAESKSAGGPDSGGGGLGTRGQAPDSSAGRVQPPAARTGAASAQPAARPQLPPPPPPREAAGSGVAQTGRPAAVPSAGPATPPQPVRRGPESGEAREGGGSGAAGTQKDTPAPVEGPAGGQRQAAEASSGPDEFAGPPSPAEPVARLRFFGATTEPDANSISTERRDAMLARFAAWWEKSIHVEAGGQLVLREDINLGSNSYRVVLAARELWAQLERYATAHRKGAAAPPDEEMIQLVFKAVVAYFDAHRPLPAGTPDPDWPTYEEFCETWSIESGQPYHELLAAMAGPEAGQQTKVV